MNVFVKILVQATMGVYKAAVEKFLPTPSKSHYVFNLRDFSRVVRGVLLTPKTHLSEGDKLIRLWVHEVYRVFYDRLVDDKDRLQFFDIVKETLHQYFKVGIDKLLVHLATSGNLKDDDIRYSIIVVFPRMSSYKLYFFFTEVCSLVIIWEALEVNVFMMKSKILQT